MKRNLAAMVAVVVLGAGFGMLGACTVVAAPAPPIQPTLIAPKQFERIEIPQWPALQSLCSHGFRVWYGYTKTGESAQTGVALTLTSQKDETCDG